MASVNEKVNNKTPLADEINEKKKVVVFFIPLLIASEPPFQWAKQGLLLFWL